VSHSARKIIVAVAPVGKGALGNVNNPISSRGVAREVIACEQAGASMVHLHVRDEKGEPTGELKTFSKTLDLIRKSSDILIQGSTGGGASLSLEERCVALNDPRVEVASLNMGSVNFGEGVYINTLPDIRYWSGRMKARGVIPELEVFEAGMISVVEKLLAEGTLTAPLHFNFCLGFQWALPATPASLFFLSSLIPRGAAWGLIQDSMTDLTLLAAAIGMGAGVVRVGFEDSVYYAPGKTAKSNTDLVRRLVALIRQMGLEPATCKEARILLGIR